MTNLKDQVNKAIKNTASPVEIAARDLFKLTSNHLVQTSFANNMRRKLNSLEPTEIAFAVERIASVIAYYEKQRYIAPIMGDFDENGDAI